MEGFFLFHAQLVLSQHRDTVEPKNKQSLLLSLRHLYGIKNNIDSIIYPLLQNSAVFGRGFLQL